MVEGAVLEEAVYPAHIFNWSVEGVPVVRGIGDETGPRFVVPRADQLFVLWEPSPHAVVPAEESSAGRMRDPNFVSIANVYRAQGNISESHALIGIELEESSVWSHMPVVRQICASAARTPWNVDQ
jgi:hypothetical protein